MDKPWDELAAALDAILPSESHSENSSSTVVNELSMQSPQRETLLDDKSPYSTNDDLRVFLEREEDNFHPADVVLGFVPRLAMNYFPATLIYRRRARAYVQMYGGSSSKDRDLFGHGGIFDPVITMEEYADQLIDSVQEQGGRFLRLDPSNAGVNVLDREVSHNLIVDYIACTNQRKSQLLSQRSRWIPSKVKRNKLIDTSVRPVKDARKCLSKQYSDSKTKAFKAKQYRPTKAILKSLDQRRNPKFTTIKPTPCRPLRRSSKYPHFLRVVPNSDHEE